MDKFLILFFLLLFVYQAICNPMWAICAYPIIGLAIWACTRLRGAKLPFFYVVFGWFPKLAQGLWSDLHKLTRI